MTYIVLDIMFSGIDPSVRRGMENDCDYIARHHRASWLESKFAIEGIGALYHEGVSEEFLRAKDRYRQYLLAMTSEDGVYTTGPGYAHSRLFMEERVQKKMFMDVCEYQGVHEFYNEPKLQRLYEWLFGYSCSPFNRTYTFGDSPPTKEFAEYSSAVLRAGRFSEAARGYAVWQMGPPRDQLLEGGLLQYLSCDSTVYTAVQPQSRIFPNGGAWLLGRQNSSHGLAGVLWNINTEHESHSHFDANSVSLTAFGEFILRNSGYDGWAEPDSGRWQWIHRTAESSNTVLPGGLNHEDFRGGGITEGILGLSLEYARGNSGRSITGGTHDRSLLMVHGDGSLPGYFILVDEVTGTGADVRLALHPNSSTAPAEISGGREYDWSITSCFSRNTIRTRIILGDKPLSAEIIDGYFGSNDECNRFVGKYLRATYAPEEGGRTRLLTVVFPYPEGNPAPAHAALPGEKGMALVLDEGTRDVVVVPRGEVKSGGVVARADAAYWRQSHGRVSAFFLLRGRGFGGEQMLTAGFESGEPVSIVMDGDRGALISPGTPVTFRMASLRTVRIDGSEVPHISAGAGFVRVMVPPGNHSVLLVLESSLSPP